MNTKAANVLDLLPPEARASVEAVRPRRTQIVVSTDEHSVNDAAIQALARAPEVYARNHQLVEVLWTEDELGQGPAIRALSPSRLREVLTTVCEFYQLRGDTQKPAHPPDWCVAAVHGRGIWPGVRQVVGLLESPALRPDGSVIQTPGYDPATGYVLVPVVQFPPVPDAPTQKDARAALHDLCDVFSDFPYAGAADRFVVIAAILTFLARPAIRGSVPAFVLRATTPGSGKGLQADVIGTIAHGRAPAKMTFPTKEEEREKVLGAYALRGAGVICFDNLVGGFGGGALDRCLTAVDTVELRVLGKSEIPELKWRAVILATGNNPEYLGDTPRRVLQSTIEPREENPEEREEKSFRHHPLLPWVQKERARLVVAGLTILRAHGLAGRPREGCRTWGSFEGWAAIIPTAIVWAGGADPMLTRPALDTEADATKVAGSELLRYLLDFFSDGFTASEVIQALYADSPRGDALRAETRAAVETLCRTKGGKVPDARLLGQVFKNLKRRTISGLRLDFAARTGNGRRWCVDGVAGADDFHTPRETSELGTGSETPALSTQSARMTTHREDDPEREAIQNEPSFNPHRTRAGHGVMHD